MNAALAQVSIKTAGADVAFHCDHDDDHASYRLLPTSEPIAVYLHGTPEQIGKFCDDLMRAVARHTIEIHERAAREVVES